MPSPKDLHILRRSWGAIALAFILAPATASAAPSDSAELHYAQGFVASGDFEGSCRLLGIRFNAVEDQVVELAATTMELVVYETRINRTVLTPQGPVPLVIDQEPEQFATTYPVGTTLTVRADSNSHLALTNEALAEWSELTADLRGGQWESTSPNRNFPTGPAYYHELRRGEMVITPQAIWGPGSIVATNATTTHVTGEGFLKADGVVLTSGTTRLDLPDLLVEESRTDTPQASYIKLRETYAVVRFQGLDAEIPAANTDVVCASLDWAGTGVVTYRAAAGRASLAGRTQEFNQRELTVDGRFQSHEETRAMGDDLGSPIVVRARNEGEYRALGMDFLRVNAREPSLADPVVKVGIVATILGTITALIINAPRLVAFLFSRIGEDRALMHPLRFAIHEASKQRPGLILRDLVAATGSHYSVVRHHAMVLTHLGLVRTLRRGKALHVYPHGASLPEARRALAEQEDAPLRFLLELLATATVPQPSAIQRIQDNFAFSRVGAWKVVRRGLVLGLIGRQKDASGVVLQRRG